jgi:hypothetical protein
MHKWAAFLIALVCLAAQASVVLGQFSGPVSWWYVMPQHPAYEVTHKAPHNSIRHRDVAHRHFIYIDCFMHG